MASPSAGGGFPALHCPQQTRGAWADRGIAKDNAALADAIALQKGSRLTRAHFPTDHAFADHRIALARAVVSWLQGLLVPAEGGSKL